MQFYQRYTILSMLNIANFTYNKNHFTIKALYIRHKIL